jgi:hypothetical protein
MGPFNSKTRSNSKIVSNSNFKTRSKIRYGSNSVLQIKTKTSGSN